MSILEQRKSTELPMKSSRSFTVTIDEDLDRTLDQLKAQFGKTSKADVFRLAIALLKIAADAKSQGLKVTVSDHEDNVRKEVVLP